MDGPLPLCNVMLLLATGAVSALAFRNARLERKLIFHPESILADKEYYRLISAAFLHADWFHLILNLVGLYSFGGVVEWYFGRIDFLLIYFGSVLGGSLLALFLHRHHDYYACGASGGVCGIIFANLLLIPGSGVSLYFVLPLPGWLYAIGFLVGSYFALKRQRDNIGHDAHLGGALVGLIIAACRHPDAVRYNWKLFTLVAGIALAMLAYELFGASLPSPGTWLKRPGKRKPDSPSNLPRYKWEECQVDAILDKVSRQGIHSLTPEESALLQATAEKYRRRSESEKPKSDLAI
jgi:membrane associated rhomboid family serine protease